MNQRHLLPLLAVALLFTSARCLAWNDNGHKVVAFIAWEDMTPKTRAVVTDLLKQHPRYEKDLLLDAPADQTDDERARTAFGMAATWPDMVRSPANPMNHVANHPVWHYIDIPYIVDGVTPVAPTTEVSGPRDAVEALTHCSAELKNANISAADKAVDICWLEHLTGDIHQPLHAVSLYSTKQPDGDRGGNQDLVRKDNFGRNSIANLHSIWDSLPGQFKSEELMIFQARGLHDDPMYSREKMKDQVAVTDYMAWAKESHELAITDVYLNNKLEYTISEGHDAGNDNADIPVLPANYLKNAEHVAMRRVALAGYRLADELNAIFDPK